jgi:uncharacterized protein (DUF1330 family)
MNRHITLALALVTGAAFGAAAVQTLRAQANPPALNISEITVHNEEGYEKDYLPLITKVIQDNGGKYLVRSDKTLSYQGPPAPPRVVVIQLESLDKVKAMYESAAFKHAQDVGRKYATQRIYAVQGISPPL